MLTVNANSATEFNGVNGQTMNRTVTSAMFLKHLFVFVESYLLDLMKIQHTYIVLDA